MSAIPPKPPPVPAPATALVQGAHQLGAEGIAGMLSGNEEQLQVPRLGGPDPFVRCSRNAHATPDPCLKD